MTSPTDRGRLPPSRPIPLSPPLGRAHILTLGNAKGGSGKSTTAMHVMTRLLGLGYRVAAIDLDGQQQTLARYLENRAMFCARRCITLPMPELKVIATPKHATREQEKKAHYASLVEALEGFAYKVDIVVIDCPGADTFLATLGHFVADTVLTPLNDSFIDLDLLARIEPETFRVLAPSWYSEMIYNVRKRRRFQRGAPLDWVVMRNRVAGGDARNKQRVQKALRQAAAHFQFREAQGLGERVIFRELFVNGLTLSDLRGRRLGVAVTMHHIAAHQEVKSLIGALDLQRKLALPAGVSLSA